MKEFGWSRIAVITQSDNLFTLVSIKLKLYLCNEFLTINVRTKITTILRQELAAANLQLIREFTFNPDGNPRKAVDSLKVSEYHN